MVADLAGALIPSRRDVIAGGAVCAVARRVLAQRVLPRQALRFQIWRGGHLIGAHRVDFEGDAAAFTVAMAADMEVKLGPIPLFRYQHRATEFWRGGRFASLLSHTDANGRIEKVSAVRTDRGIAISATGRTSFEAPAQVHPLTHWNAAVLDGPLFNPQTGALLVERVRRKPAQTVRLADGAAVSATLFILDGRTVIMDWYDGRGVWTALRGRAPDGSWLDYRRLV